MLTPTIFFPLSFQGTSKALWLNFFPPYQFEAALGKEIFMHIVGNDREDSVCSPLPGELRFDEEGCVKALPYTKNSFRKKKRGEKKMTVLKFLSHWITLILTLALRATSFVGFEILTLFFPLHTR